MSKKMLWVVLAVLVVLSGITAFLLVKRPFSKPTGTVLMDPKGKVIKQLSTEEALKIQQSIPTLPGQFRPKPVSQGPDSYQQNMRTIEEVNRINQMNKNNNK